jgi:soluble lytic murein transglycosylase
MIIKMIMNLKMVLVVIRHLVSITIPIIIIHSFRLAASIRLKFLHDRVDEPHNLQYKQSMTKRVLFAFFILTLLTACGGPSSNSRDKSPSGDQSYATELAPTPTPTSTPTPLPRARVMLGQQDILKGDYDAALNEFWTARQQSSDPEVIAAAQLGVGRVLLLQEDYTGAIEQFNWLQDNFAEGETRDTAYFFLAQAYEMLGEYRLAAEAYAQYVTSQPGPLDSEILEMKGDALMSAGEPTLAMQAYLNSQQSASPARVEQLEVKAARAASAAGDNEDAVNRYVSLLETSTQEPVQSQVNFLLGQMYLSLGSYEQAYARFQDSVIRFPAYYDTFSGLSALVDAGEPVDDLLRGIVDYYAGQYGTTITVMDRYMLNNPDHDGTPLYYKALSLWQIGDYEGELATWDKLINTLPTDKYLPTAYLEKSSTLWRYLEDYEAAADNLLQYVAIYPETPEAPEFLNTAGKIYEIGGYLSKAARTWTRIFNEYPSSSLAYSAVYDAGIVTYRLQRYADARLIFLRLLVLATTPEDIAAANFWVAKCHLREDNPDAQKYFKQAAEADPGGFYSIRAGQILNGQDPFPPQSRTDISIDLEQEKKSADKWLRKTFEFDKSIDLDTPAELAENPLFKRGEEYWKLGMRDQARSEFELLRNELQSDALNSYRLMNHMLELGFYQTAALTSRQVLNLAGLNQAATLTDAPDYFNHIRFGIFYSDIVIPAALEHDIDPLLLFSIIRQESLFDASITSSAGARGLMQITEGTGEYIAANFGWPPGYTSDDLDRPYINIRLGAHYLKLWIDRYGGQITPPLASYNAGDGNTLVWKDLAGDDVDLFVEIIRFDETRDYIMYITENYEIYKALYSHP